MVQITNCDTLDRWGFAGSVGTIDTVDKTEGTGSLNVQGNTGGWNAYADYSPANPLNLVGQKLTFPFKTDDPSPSIIQVTLMAPDWGNTLTYEFTKEASAIWRDIAIDLANPTSTSGTPDLSNITYIRFTFQNRGQPYNYKIDIIEYSPVSPPPPPPPPGELPLILENNFIAGNIDPLVYAGDGGYSVFDAANDPLGTNSPGVTIWNSPTENSRGSLRYELASAMSPLRETLIIAFDTITSAGVLILPWRAYSYGICEIYANASGFTIIYANNGKQTIKIDMALQAKTKYKITVEAKLGYNDGELHVSVNDVELLTLTGLNNLEMLPYRTTEFGCMWGDLGTKQHIYYIGIWGAEVPIVTLSGQVKDAITGLEVPYAGVRIGWSENYIANTIADSSGVFTLQVPAGTYEDLKVIALGYGLAGADPGSITHFGPVTVTAPETVLDLSIYPQTPIQPSDLASPYIWSCRAVVIFPWTFGSYDDAQFEECLDELKEKMPHVNTVEIRLYLYGHQDRVDFCDAWGNEVNALSYNSMSARAINLCHAKGFKVFVGIGLNAETNYPFSPSNPEAFFISYQDKLVKYCRFLNGESVMEISDTRIEQPVEFIALTFEAKVNMFEYDSYLQGLFPACRAVTNAKLGFHHMGMIYAPPDTRSGSWWHDADFVFGFGWQRLTYIFDPSESSLMSGWRAPPDWCYSSDPASPWKQTCLIYKNWAEYIQSFTKVAGLPKDIPALINTGATDADGTCLNPWGTASHVTDYEEQALYWKTFFQFFKDVPNIFGCDAERHGDPIDPSRAGNCSFRQRLAEAFIDKGFKAVSEEEPHPPSPSASPLALLALAILAYIATKR